MDVWIYLLLFVIVGGTIGGSLWWWRWRRPHESDIAVVESGKFAAMQAEQLGVPDEWAARLGLDPGVDLGVEGTALDRSFSPPPAPGPDIVVGLAAGGVEATALAVDWAHVNDSVLAGYARYTNDETAGILDLYSDALGRSGDSLDGWVYGLRGHIGEQEVFNQLSAWLGDGLVVPGAGNFPGIDAEILGSGVNVKVTNDVASTAAEHFAKNPDVPLIVNADASNIPDSAVHLDTSQPFDTSILGEENLIIVAEGLEIGGLMDGLADVTEFGDLGGAMDGLAGIGIVIAATRSGIRESRLLAIHEDKQRLVKNVATDAALIGGGGLAGAKAGALTGVAIDAAIGGTGMGIPTLLFGLVGGMGGGTAGALAANRVRTKTYRKLQGSLTEALNHYGTVLDRVEQETEVEWTTVLGTADDDMKTAHKELIKLRDEVVNEATRLLQTLSDLSPVDRDLLIVAARARVDQALAAENSLVAHQRAEAWEAKARNVGDDLDKVMDLVIASPGGDVLVRSWLDNAKQAQADGLRVLAAGHELIRAGALQARTTTSETLDRERDRLQHAAKSRLAIPLQEVNRNSNAVEAEASALGVMNPDQDSHDETTTMS